MHFFLWIQQDLVCGSLYLLQPRKGGDGCCSYCNRDWCVPSFPSVAHSYCQHCVICQQHNIGKAVKAKRAAHLPPWGPFVNIQIDFIQMSICCGYEYVLVLVDVFTTWVEAFPCRTVDVFAYRFCTTFWHPCKYQQ